MADQELSLEQFKRQDEEIRRIVQATPDVSTLEAVSRCLHAHWQQSQSWATAAGKLAEKYGFKWPDYKNPILFEIPLQEAWDRDRERIRELEARLQELEAKPS